MERQGSAPHRDDAAHLAALNESLKVVLVDPHAAGICTLRSNPCFTHL
jgi:hypothetical protein